MNIDVLFTKLELLYIDDKISEDVHDVSKELMMKLGSAIVMLIEEDFDTTTLPFNEDELWVVRNLATSSVSIGNEPVGLSLKMKIYKALGELKSDDILSDFTFSDEEGMSRIDIDEDSLREVIGDIHDGDGNNTDTN